LLLANQPDDRLNAYLRTGDGHGDGKANEGDPTAFHLAAFGFFFGGRPTPGDFVSQLGCLHFGQWDGLPSIRFTHA
jgi:hypothetical protein